MSEYTRSAARTLARLTGACTLLLGIGLLLAWPSGAEPSAPVSAPASTAPASPADTGSTSAQPTPMPTVIDDSGMTLSSGPTPVAVGASRTRTSQSPSPSPSYGIGDAVSTSRAVPSYGIGDAVSTSRAVPTLGTDATSSSRRTAKHVAPRHTEIVDKMCPGIGFVANNFVCPPAARPTTATTGTDGVARTGRPVIGLIVTGVLLTGLGALVYLGARRWRHAAAR